MINWNYKILSTRHIDLNKGDFRKSVAIFSEDERLRACIGCGGCTGSCTAAAITDFNFRKLHTLIRRGSYTGVKEEIDKCMLCGKCTIICPRGINTRKIFYRINDDTIFRIFPTICNTI